MTKSLSLLIVMSFLLLVSCSRDVCLCEEPAEGQDVLICCTPSEDATKTTLSSNYRPLWESGDAIAVMSSGGQAAKFTLVEGFGTATGSFKGTLPASVDGKYLALYPYSEDASYSSGNVTFDVAQCQSGRTGTFSSGTAVMIASFSGDAMTVKFRNVMGLLRISMSGTAKISKATLKGNDTDCCLHGKAALTVDGTEGTDAQRFTVSGGSNEVSLEFASPISLSSDRTTEVYFPLAPGSLRSGFTITLFDESGDPIYTKGTDKDQSIIRSRIKSMPDMTGIKPLAESIENDPTLWSAYNNDSRTNAAGATVIDPQSSGYPSNNGRNKYVGVFYFVLHGSHGYDTPGGSGTFTRHFSLPTSSDVSSPYDVQKMLGDGNYGYSNSFSVGSMSNTYHWGKPYLGYYISNDSWVIRKHAQMLADAGVDFVAFDVTNHYSYLDIIENISKVYMEMRKEGNKTPQLTFLMNSEPASTASDVYKGYYTAHPEYENLWFKWEGKPLLLVDKSSITDNQILDFFTFRQSWYLWNSNWQTASDKGDKWWGTGEDKWPWGCCYTENNKTNGQKAGTHNGINECASVMPATHPISNIGRSYVVGSGVTYKTGSGYTKNPGDGIYFKSQFEAANALDPQVIFFTGWNEWGATRYPGGTLGFNYMCGTKAESVLVDQYNYEYSRDIEPLDEGFGDNYYYYMVDFIRQFKGVSETPTFSAMHSIVPDGDVTDWAGVESSFKDDSEDTKWRGYDSNSGNGWYGWGRYNKSTSLVNKTGRNDIVICRVASDDSNLSFCVTAADELISYADGENGLNLYLSVGDVKGGGWEGFNFRLMPASSKKAVLYTTNSGWNWTVVDESVPIAVRGKNLEACIPLSALGITSPRGYAVDFKWVDCVYLNKSDGIQRCMRDGDSAPNGRFRYRYVFN